MITNRILCVALSALFAVSATALVKPNYDNGAPVMPADSYPMPDILALPEGGKVSSAKEWETVLKPKVLDFFDSQIYGAIPPRAAETKFILAESSDDALGGIAKRRQYKIVSRDANGEHSFDVLIYLPKNANADRKAPLFICPNFSGNHSITDEREVFLPKGFVYGKKSVSEENRGWRPERIPVRDIVSRGFAIATFCYGSVYPDYWKKAAPQESIYRIFPPEKAGQKTSISAWAWGNIRVCDLAETLPEIDARKIAVAGQSRLSKTALITGAHDTRFALVCANCGGCKRIALMPTTRFFFWFSPNMKKYADNENSVDTPDELKAALDGKTPVKFDQYSLIACIAPRALFISAASRDIYAPPHMQFSAYRALEPVYRLYGAKNFAPDGSAESPVPFFGDIAYNCKKGVHSITPDDWKNFMDYAEKLGWKPVVSK